LQKIDTGAHFVPRSGGRAALLRYLDLSHPDGGPDYICGAFESYGPFGMG